MRRILAPALLLGLAAAAAGASAAAQDILTVGGLLADCKKSGALCAQDLSSNEVSMAFLWGGNCIPAQLTQQQRYVAVLRWLAAHPDLAREDAPNGIADAVTDLWPCASTP
jgi:hypothetical protein